MCSESQNLHVTHVEGERKWRAVFQIKYRREWVFEREDREGEQKSLISPVRPQVSTERESSEFSFPLSFCVYSTH